jgi:hypothetical protein
MKSRPSTFAVKLAVFGVIILPTALFIMRLIHVLLLGGRDIRSQPLLLALLGLAALSIASILTFAGFVLFFATEDAIRRRFAGADASPSEIRPLRTGVEKISDEWFEKGVRFFNSHHYAEAIHCFKMAQRLGLQTPQLAAIRNEAEAALSNQNERSGAAPPTASRAPLLRPFITITEPIPAQLGPDEIARDQALLAQYKSTRKGQFALLRSGELVGFFRTFATALQNGYQHSQSGRDFTIIPITPDTGPGPRFFECLN